MKQALTIITLLCCSIFMFGQIQTDIKIQTENEMYHMHLKGQNRKVPMYFFYDTGFTMTNSLILDTCAVITIHGDTIKAIKGLVETVMYYSNLLSGYKEKYDALQNVYDNSHCDSSPAEDKRLAIALKKLHKLQKKYP